MSSLRQEIEDELKRTRLDKTRLYELLLKIVDGGAGGSGGVGPAGPAGPTGPHGPPGTLVPLANASASVFLRKPHPHPRLRLLSRKLLLRRRLPHPPKYI